MRRQRLEREPEPDIVNDDNNESVDARGCEGMATVARVKKMGAESGREAVYNSDGQRLWDREMNAKRRAVAERARACSRAQRRHQWLRFPTIECCQPRHMT